MASTVKDEAVKLQKNIDAVYEAGKDAEKSRWWGSFQGNGNRANYNYAFYTSYWSDDTFQPKHDIAPTSANYTFRACSITDLRQLLLDYGVILDTSKCTSLEATFSANDITALPVISTVKCSTLTLTFNNASKLVTIEKVIFNADGTQKFSSNPFGGLSALENIVVEGVIGNSISFANSSKLTHDSLMSIINALQDKTGASGTFTLTIGSANIAKLTEDEVNSVYDKGWTVS